MAFLVSVFRHFVLSFFPSFFTGTLFDPSFVLVVVISVLFCMSLFLLSSLPVLFPSLRSVFLLSVFLSFLLALSLSLSLPLSLPVALSEAKNHCSRVELVLYTFIVEVERSRKLMVLAAQALGSPRSLSNEWKQPGYGLQR